MHKNMILAPFVIIFNSISLEIYTCGFLQRYGVNSYITNIPLFFKPSISDIELQKEANQLLNKKNRNPEERIKKSHASSLPTTQKNEIVPTSFYTTSEISNSTTSKIVKTNNQLKMIKSEVAIITR